MVAGACLFLPCMHPDPPPLSALCSLMVHRSGQVRGLAGQTDLVWESVGDLREEVGQQRFEGGESWDVRMALAVLEATAGAAGQIWESYGTRHSFAGAPYLFLSFPLIFLFLSLSP